MVFIQALEKYSDLECNIKQVDTLVRKLIRPCHVDLTVKAKKNLSKVPSYIKEKLLLWVDSIERIGINKTRIIPGYHDEPLKGER